MWKSGLLHQFHDIVRGTSIAWVQRNAETAYTEIAAELEEIIAEAADVLAGPRDERAWVLNVAPQPRTEVVTISAGEPVPTPPGAQRLSDGGFAALADIPASGAGRFVEPDAGVPPVTVSGLVIDNGLVRVTLDECGCLASVLDLAAGREVLAAAGRGNLLQLHPDLPNQWDAWDVDRHYRHRLVDLTDGASVTVTDRRRRHDNDRAAQPAARTAQPGSGCDQGQHRFCYALLPGATLADAVAHGYALNLPLRVVRGGAGALPAPLLEIDGGGVTVESIKL